MHAKGCCVPVRLLIAFIMCGMAGMTAGSLADEPVQIQPGDDQFILGAFLKHAGESVEQLKPERVAKIDQPEDICWTWSQYARMPLAAFRLTGDARYLDEFTKGMDGLLTRLRKAPDGYLGFRGLPLPLFRDHSRPEAEIDVDITDFEIARLICDFAEVVRADDSLEDRYGSKAADYLALAEKDLAGKKWEARKLYVDLGNLGSVFRMPAECGNLRDSLTNPHNKQSKMCRAFLALYRVTGKDEYFQKAVKLGIRFKHTLELEGDQYRWHYWDPAGDWDRKPDKPGEWKHWIGPEHRGGYHALTFAMVDALYDHGVVFDRTDIDRFLATQMTVCWNGSCDAPAFRNTAGKPMRDAEMIAPALSRFEPKIREYCYGPNATANRLKRLDHGWQGGVLAIDYLCGKYLERCLPEPSQTKYREQFCRKPENVAFLKQVEFRIQPSGSKANSE